MKASNMRFNTLLRQKNKDSCYFLGDFYLLEVFNKMYVFALFKTNMYLKLSGFSNKLDNCDE